MVQPILSLKVKDEATSENKHDDNYFEHTLGF